MYSSNQDKFIISDLEENDNLLLQEETYAGNYFGCGNGKAIKRINGRKYQMYGKGEWRYFDRTGIRYFRQKGAVKNCYRSRI